MVSQGYNDACAFHIKLNGWDYVGLEPTNSKAFQRDYDEIDERRKIFARQLALDNKIEKSEVSCKFFCALC